MNDSNFLFYSEKTILDKIEYKKLDIIIKDSDGNLLYELKDASFPKDWSYTTCRIISSKYFSRYKDKKETSVKEMIKRVTNRIEEYANLSNYGTHEDNVIFKEQLNFLLSQQMVAFNSPVWFNIGNFDLGEEQLSACFCLKQEDSMESLMKIQKECVEIYRKSSGTGQLNRARSKRDILSGGGKPSGPMPFIEARDGWAKSTKSGGITRRAAAMELMDCDHADIFEFIRAKAIEEEKAFTSSIYEKKYQNSNFTIRLIDGFWNKLSENKKIECYGTKNQLLLSYNPDELLDEVSKSTWRSGDPGIQFMDTIHKWSTYNVIKETIICNPCGEYLGVEDSSCNLASLNMLKFIDIDSGTIKIKELKKAIFIIIKAMDLFVHHAKYPTKAIESNTHFFRPLGLGFCNLGATLMYLGMSYDSDKGREFAATFTALMNYYALQASAIMAKNYGAASGYNKVFTLKYMDTLANDSIFKRISNRDTYDIYGSINIYDIAILHQETYELIKEYGLRNITLTALAPTGTISFLMGADSTGCEPLTALELYKSLAGEDTIKLEYDCVKHAKAKIKAKNKNKSDKELEKIYNNDPILLTAFENKIGKALSPKSHIDMVAALQPFIMMGISKTCNVPESTTVKKIKDLYIYAHEQGLKSITIYRNNSKSFQVLTSANEKKKEPTFEENITNKRITLPSDLSAIRHKVVIAGHKMRIIHCNFPKTNKVAEIFTKMTRDGSTLSGLLDAWVKTLSIALQYGVPFESFYKHLSNTIFEPKGFTSNEKIRGCTSIVDYIMKYLKLEMGGKLNGENKDEGKKDEGKKDESMTISSYSPICHKCGNLTIPDGVCFTCPNCGASTGCSG